MSLAVERLGAQRPIYVGDTPDDLLAVQRFNETCRQDAGGTMLACMVLTGLGWAAKDRFISEQAHLIADNVNAALAAVSQCIGGALCPAEKQR
jgi:phosphoglycolate phosphatase-like HAD superfamily hydrolase